MAVLSRGHIPRTLGKTTDSVTAVLADDVSGTPISARQVPDGGYHLGVAMTQDVYPDDNNSSTTNLTSGNSYTFTGTATSTLGVVGLQWSLDTDQNATVYIEQSPDGTNWDITNHFEHLSTNGGAGNTVQALSSYWRVRVVLSVAVDTTYFRLQGVLCPIASPLPRALSSDSRLMSESTITSKDTANRHVWVSPTNSLSVVPTVRLVGSSFDGTAKDTNFWTETVAGTGTVGQSGEIELATGTTANSSAQYQSVRKARFVGGAVLKFMGLFKFVTAGTANNVRRCGAYTATDGYFFQLSGSTFSIGTRRASSDTLVSSGSFNGVLGMTLTVNTTSYYKLEIEWAPGGAFFYVNGRLLHSIVTGHLSDFLTLPLTFQNTNSGGSTANVVFDCIATVISREGELETNSTYKYLSGAGTTVLKRGAGALHAVINNDNSGSVILYDNTAGSGTIIASIDLAKVLGSLKFGLSFNTGLTAVVTGSGVKLTFVYE